MSISYAPICVAGVGTLLVLLGAHGQALAPCLGEDSSAPRQLGRASPAPLVKCTGCISTLSVGARCLRLTGTAEPEQARAVAILSEDRTPTRNCAPPASPQHSAPANTRYDTSGDQQHFLATVSGLPAGCVRFVPSKGKLTRLAVLKEYRMTGAGRELVKAMEKWVVRAAREGDERVKGLVGEKGVHVKIHSQVSCVGAGLSV